MINSYMLYFIYKTTNIINGKYYIGAHQTETLENDYYKGSGSALLEAFKVYGRKNFKREIIEYCSSEEDLFKREAEIVNKSLIDDRQCYNLKIGGKGGSNQTKSESHKQKLSESAKLYYENNNDTRNAGRKNIMSAEELFAAKEKYGSLRKAADGLGLTYDQFSSRYCRALRKNKKKNTHNTI